MLRESPAYSGYSTTDLGAARQFYAETLGLAVDDTPEGLRLAFAGGHTVFIYPKGPDHRPATFTVLNFPVHDVVAAVDWLTARGIKMERYEGMDQDERGIVRPPSADLGPQIAWFTDPAGNILSVIQE
jgi:catechol 2,3-dioxygenase-like lactoylglutathione lyase family enzyme